MLSHKGSGQLDFNEKPHSPLILRRITVPYSLLPMQVSKELATSNTSTDMLGYLMKPSGA